MGRRRGGRQHRERVKSVCGNKVLLLLGLLQREGANMFMVEKCSVAAFSDIMADEQLLQVVSDLGRVS